MHQPLPSPRRLLEFLGKRIVSARKDPVSNIRAFLFGCFVVLVAVLATYGSPAS
ncbi:MAG TPA: hypothetical protein VG734_14230 [Lacunisphaera sp.]|nr:hypothetical protein [Lacunisphaera sp.]